jgi:transcription elongation factor/antiterminator RfaH
MAPQWYAVQTKPRAEERAMRWLRERTTLPLFLPKLAVPRYRGGRRVTAIEVLFPSYLFVHMPLELATWSAVRWTPGVKEIVGVGGVPVPVPDEAIELLRARALEDDVIPWRASYPAGARVRIVRGPFAGLIGILERPTTRHERVRVLLSLLGGQRPVEVDVLDLEEVG